MTIMKVVQPERSDQSNQIFSQILVPFVIAFIATAVAGYFLFSSLVSGTSEIRMWSDISVMIIFLPLIFFGLPLLLIIIAHIVLTVKIQQKVGDIGKKIRPVFIKSVVTASDLANLLSKPLIALKSGIPFFMNKK
jgi:asparagine N-glycosylation enzyme membrane subunit Stt3